MAITIESLARLALPLPTRGAFLAERERRTLLAAADVLLDGVDFATPREDIIANVETFIRSSRRGWRVRVLLGLVEIAPLLRGRRPFSRLTRAERRNFLRKNGHSICGRIRPLVYIGAYASPKAARSVGWVPVLERARFVELRSARR